MCDYSLEGFHSIDAVEGETYRLDTRIAHGAFMVPINRHEFRNYQDVTLCCVKPGQRLRLTNLYSTNHALPEAIVTVVQRRRDPVRHRHFGPYQDGIEFDDGVSWPLADLAYADMEVLPVEVKPRDLDQMLGLGQVKAKVPELIDGD